MRLAVIALVVASGGCSFGARVSQPKACTPLAWPIVDSAFTVATAVPVVAATTGDRKSVGYAIAITPLTLALAASAAYGYVRWSRCPKPPAPQDPYAER